MSENLDGRQARWQQHNSERRQRIIQAAIEVIESHTPGAEIHVQQIAERAGLSRTVVYRHFSDRGDLDRAVQEAILEGVWAALLPAVRLDGTVPGLIRRVVGTYVDWAVAHPALHRLADHDTTRDGSGPLERGMERIAAEIGAVMAMALDALDAKPDEEQREALDPLVFGIVGAVFGAVRRWLNRPGRVLSPSRLIDFASESVWFIIQGHARSLGVEIDPDMPLEDLMTAALAPTPPTA